MANWTPSLSRAGGAAQIYSGCERFATAMARLIRAGFPKIPRRVSGYNLDEFLPENGFHVARSLVGTEGTCAIVLEAKVRLFESPQHRTLVALGYRGCFRSRGSRSRDSGISSRSGSRALKEASSTALKKKGAPNLELLPKGRGFPLSNSEPTMPAGSNEATKLSSTAETNAEPPDIRRLQQGRGSPRSGKYASPDRARPRAPGAPPEWEGWDDAAVAPENGGYLRDIRHLLDEYNYHAASTGTLGTAASTCGSLSIWKARLESASTANSWSARRTWS